MERTDLVMRYHRRAQVSLPNETLHALVHVVVENQAALGDETPVAATVERLCREGLDRHEALHAVGSVLSEQLWKVSNGVEDDFSKAYFDDVQALTAQKWLASANDSDDGGETF